ncbi:hypothetical protein [Enterobacter cloacae]|uniref:hypothetical protein n=1 Tax=Enterobacter cloacae TaxID=550 RepID=UPI0020755188|nr:hypothetical protein [Enterobacter cloacae]HAS0824993.1 hypothetical protein [Enterobacter cloacae subsp. cloacae]EKD5160997.1 hypothetical protein [Enterobacter cloacae]ELV2841677.1 hypothetical protein [Enterobacter cloacae]MCM7404771.1 hypothetical protein [Enterobacter cloacae]HAS1958475.1 hypothetical protein [Enterobacter cloacae]
MKSNATILTLSLLIAGCSSGSTQSTVDYNTASPAALCAALGGFKAQHNEAEYNHLQDVARSRIESDDFNIDAKQCQELAIKGMIATSLNEELNNANCSEVS